jgi:ABC-type sugar transport system substrate-binding protein
MAGGLVTTSQLVVRGARGRPRYAVLAVLVAIAVVILSGCSSSKSSSGSSTSGAGGSTGGSSGTSAGGGVDAAKAFVAKYSVRPTQIPVTQKVGKPIPKGKTVYFISCGTPECSQEAAIIKQGTDALGWTLNTINTSGTPESQKSAFQQAAQAKPAGVIYTAIDESVFQSEIPQIHSGGGILAACCITDPISSNGIDYGVEIPTQTGFVGQLQAAFVAADSNGKAKTAFINIPSIPILTFAKDNYDKSLPNYCSSCSADTLDVPISALGKDVPQRVVSYLRAHPDVNYIALSTDSLAVGLPAAMKAAGLTKVKIVGQGATATNLQYLRSGQQTVSVAFPFYESMFMMLDAVVRHAAGAPIIPSTTPPQWLLTQDNAPNTDQIFPIVTNCVDQFKALWGLTS